MRKIFVFLLLFACIRTYSQNVGIGTNTPSGSAILELSSTDKGLLLPRMTAVQRLAVTPTNGLLVYDLDSSSLFIYEATAWKRLRAISNLESLITGTVAGDIIQWDGTKWVVVSTPVKYPLTVTQSGGGPASVISSSVAGIYCGLDCAESYNSGTVITLTANPGSGYTFSGWSGACTGTGPCVVTMNAAKSVMAAFSHLQYTLATSATLGGTITSSPSGINCGADCSELYDDGSLVTLTANPASGATFTGWSGACSGTGACVVTMDAAKSVSASFQYPLGITKTGNGVGTVTSSPAGISCGTTCSTDFNGGTVVTLTATPNATSAFTGWSGPCYGTGPCVVTMDAVKQVNANFNPVTYTLFVSNAGTGTGTVTSSPSGITCQGDCSESYNSGTSVTLSATPSATSAFTGWSGACTGTGPCIVSMDAAKFVTATFTQTNYALTVTKSGGGTVSSDQSGIYCGNDCIESYPAGSVLTLTATPDAGATFTGWSGACSGTGACILVMSSAKSVTATFTQPLTVSKTGSGSGTVTSIPAGINCGATCSSTYSNGTIISLTASPDANSVFTGWSGACSGTGLCSVTMDAAKNVTAFFTKAQYILNTSKTGTGDGTVSSSPAGISCGSACSNIYDANTTVTLTASPDALSTFSGWSGACTGIGTCIITMDAIKNVQATFSKTLYTLTVTKSGPGNGTIASDPVGVYCGADCSENYPAGTTVTLTAVPNGGSTFAGWSGACTGTGPCVVPMTSAKTVTATFN